MIPNQKKLKKLTKLNATTNRIVTKVDMNVNFKSSFIGKMFSKNKTVVKKLSISPVESFLLIEPPNSQ